EPGGVHFSKVRSLTLDSWEPELVKLMCELGNSALNRIYEARVEEMGVKRPPPPCSRAQREDWILAKYVEKKFISRLPGGAGPPVPRPPRAGTAPRARPAPAPPEAESPPNLHPGALLYWAAWHRRLPAMADALANNGADPGWVNAAEDHRTPLLQAVAVNSLLACEFLLQNGASVNQSDSRGRGAAAHATMLGHTGLACLFLKRGADVNAVDAEGKDPLSIAIDLANADIVTLLPAKMRELEVAQGQTGDDTYLDIFRDISLMASAPEKLARPPHKLTTLLAPPPCGAGHAPRHGQGPPTRLQAASNGIKTPPVVPPPPHLGHLEPNPSKWPSATDEDGGAVAEPWLPEEQPEPSTFRFLRFALAEDGR
ncbi:LOW QUALITY PROTEIN: arf-GAP with coiled-coil, ANK repeat and PH domain-containing protein 1-like, partial [Chlamydotis macqueenii]